MKIPAREAFSILEAGRSAARDRPALVDDEGATSFAQLAELVGLRLQQLGTLGLDHGRWIARTGRRDVATIVDILACFETGQPVALTDPRWTERERRSALAGAQVSADLDRLLPGATVDLSASLHERQRRGRDSLHRDERAPRTPSDRSPLAAVFTSGTAGQTRAVSLSRGAMHASARASAARLGWNDDDRWLLSLPLSHVGGLSVLTRCLAARRTLVFGSGGRFDPAKFIEHASRHSVTICSLVPTMLARIVEARLSPPESMRMALVGGAATCDALLSAARALGWPVLTTYGMSEASSQIATQDLDCARDEGAVGHCGSPLESFEVAISERGEILVRGPALFSGYLPSESIENRMLHNGFFRTGDLGSIDDAGRLSVRGRFDDAIQTGGELVSPDEIEQRLLKLPQVADAFAFGVADDEWGEAVSVAIVCADGHTAPTVDELRAALRDELAGFKLPRRVFAVAQIPRGDPALKPARRVILEALRPELR